MESIGKHLYSIDNPKKPDRLDRKKERKKMDIEQEMMMFPITRKAWIQAGKIFQGIAIPCDKRTADGGTIRSEKVLKFNRTALKALNKPSEEKVDPRFKGGDDLMRFKVGKPGSKERIDALALQYASLAEDEMSPFEEG